MWDVTCRRVVFCVASCAGCYAQSCYMLCVALCSVMCAVMCDISCSVLCVMSCGVLCGMLYARCHVLGVSLITNYEFCGVK